MLSRLIPLSSIAIYSYVGNKETEGDMVFADPDFKKLEDQIQQRPYKPSPFLSNGHF